MQAGQPGGQFAELVERARRADRYPGHAAEHGDADLDADAGEEADEHGARQEIRQEAEAEDARDQQQGGGEDRD